MALGRRDRALHHVRPHERHRPAAGLLPAHHGRRCRRPLREAQALRGRLPARHPGDSREAGLSHRGGAAGDTLDPHHAGGDGGTDQSAGLPAGEVAGDPPEPAGRGDRGGRLGRGGHRGGPPDREAGARAGRLAGALGRLVRLPLAGGRALPPAGQAHGTGGVRAPGPLSQQGPPPGGGGGAPLVRRAHRGQSQLPGLRRHGQRASGTGRDGEGGAGARGDGGRRGDDPRAGALRDGGAAEEATSSTI